MEKLIVAVSVCVVLPIVITYLCVWSRAHSVDKRTEVLLKALESGEGLDPKLLLGEPRRPDNVKMALVKKIQTGIALAISGVFVLSIATGGLIHDGDAASFFTICGGVLIGVGLGYIGGFFIGRKMLEKEIQDAQ